MIVTDIGPLTVAPWILVANAGPVRIDVACASMFLYSASPLSGVPSWKEMPLRIVIVNDVKSSFDVIDSARNGWT